MSEKAVQTKEMLSKQAVKIAKQAEEHERFINKVSIRVTIAYHPSSFDMLVLD